MRQGETYKIGDAIQDPRPDRWVTARVHPPRRPDGAQAVPAQWTNACVNQARASRSLHKASCSVVVSNVFPKGQRYLCVVRDVPVVHPSIVVHVGRVHVRERWRGPHRCWEDCRRCRRYGFLAAGHGSKWSQQLRRLVEGARVYAYLRGRGYVGLGNVLGPPRMARDLVLLDGSKLFDHDLQQPGLRTNASDRALRMGRARSSGAGRPRRSPQKTGHSGTHLRTGRWAGGTKFIYCAADALGKFAA